MRIGALNRKVVALTLIAGSLIATFMLGIVTSRADSKNGREFGLSTEQRLQRETEELFGFGRPVPAAATTQSSTEPGPKAVQVARGLKVQLVSDKVGEDADMIALWPNDENPTYVIICNEINGAPAGSPATVQRVELATGNVSDMIFGNVACDPAHRTSWGTIIVGEEAGSTGRVYEILDPLAVNNVTVNRTTGTTSDPARVVARTALGQVSFEGIVLLPDGTAYYGDELRPSNGRAGGGMYKFVPTTKRDPNAGPITSLDQSPLAAGSVYVLRVGLRNGGTDFGQGSNTGAGKWIGPLAPGNLAANAITAGGYTGYYRPEDMDLDPIAFANGQIRFCWPNTGIDTGANWGEVLCAVDTPTSDTTFATGSKPIVSPFVIGNPNLRMPDNVDFQPGTGILYVLMDATTSAENPSFGNDDVWACLPDGADSDILSDGCVRVMTLKDGNAEFTGIKFFADGKSFLIHLQHRTQTGRAVPATADMLKVSGLQIEDDK